MEFLFLNIIMFLSLLVHQCVSELVEFKMGRWRNSLFIHTLGVEAREQGH